MLKDFFTAGPTDDSDAVTGHYDETASDDPSRNILLGDWA